MPAEQDEDAVYDHGLWRIEMMALVDQFYAAQPGPAANRARSAIREHVEVSGMHWRSAAKLRDAAGVRAVVVPSDEECDKAAAQAMDRVAAAKRLHALEINPDVTAHDTLRRELIRAGYALATAGVEPSNGGSDGAA